MTQIARVYDNSQNATDAVNELKNRKIDNVAVVSAPQKNGQAQASNTIDIVAAIEQAGLEAASADRYAERIKRGGSVVIVNAPFGTAAKTQKILEAHGPGETIIPDTIPRAGSNVRAVTASDPTAAPLSAALNIPVLADSTPAATLAAPKTLSSMLGIPELTTFHSRFPLLTESQAPMSSLTESQKAFASLTASQEPFSKLSSNQDGHASLIDSPTPFSSWLKLPVLLGDGDASWGSSADIKSLDDLFVHMLQDIYYAEKKITRALPDMISKATNPKLKHGLETHLAETREQVQRLEQVFRMHGREPRATTCPAIDGIIEEAKRVSGDAAAKSVLDAAIIASARAVEHYEITRYGSLIAWARQLGRDDCAALLEQTLQEEKAADRALTELAESRVDARAA
jgi:ferritin-like metal-binding protein YciE